MKRLMLVTLVMGWLPSLVLAANLPSTNTEAVTGNSMQRNLTMLSAGQTDTGAAFFKIEDDSSSSGSSDDSSMSSGDSGTSSSDSNSSNDSPASDNGMSGSDNSSSGDNGDNTDSSSSSDSTDN